MQFYRVDGIAANEMWAEDTENCRATQEMARKINMLSDDFNRKLREKAYFFVTEANGAALTIGVITRDAEKLRDQLGNYLRALGVELKDTKREEITFRNMKRMLSYASRRDYIDDDDGVLAQFGLDRLCSSTAALSSVKASLIVRVRASSVKKQSAFLHAMPFCRSWSASIVILPCGRAGGQKGAAGSRESESRRRSEAPRAERRSGRRPPG